MHRCSAWACADPDSPSFSLARPSLVALRPGLVHPGRVIVWGPCLLSGCAGPQSTLDPAGPVAAHIAELWWLMFAVGLLVFILVMALLVRSLHSQRRCSDADVQTLIIGAGIVLPSLLLSGLVAMGMLRQAEISLLPAEQPLIIDVQARRWSWEFSYPESNAPERRLVNEVLLPRGQVVEFHLRSEDVIHSFWIPRLGGKMDVIPGRTNRLRLRADQLQAGHGQCAEFCGSGHAHMRFAVRVLETDAFDAWLAAPAAAGAPR